MFNGRGGFGMLVIGLGIGVGVGLLLAPCSGEETREWLTETAEDKLKHLRRQGRRVVFQAQDILDKSQDSVSKILKNSKSALDTVADRLT
jgi:gas vesicle protein